MVEERMSGSAENVVAAVRAAGGDVGSVAAVQLETFFAGNDVIASIAPNLMEHPGVPAIREALEQVEARTDVSELRVLVELEFDEYAPGEWPYGVAIHVATSAPLSELDGLTSTVGTEPAFEGTWGDIVNPSDVTAGQRMVTIWWD